MGKTKSQKSIDKSPEKAGPSSGKAKQPSIQRMLVTRPMSSPQKLKKCPNDAWTDSMGLGAFGIRFSKPGKPDIAAYCNDFLRELRDRNSRLRKRYQNLEDGLHFFKVCIIRSEDGDNVAMAATPGSEYGYFQLVFFYENPDDNTSKNRKKIALIVCEDINILAVQHFCYPSEFRYAGDLTNPDEEEYPCH